MDLKITFKELKEKYKDKVVTDEEFRLIDYSLDDKFDRIEFEECEVYKYSAVSKDDCFDFYYGKILI